MSPIPEITDPMGRHWRQPPREDIEIDDTHALMSKSTLEQLGNYSCSMPSGVYPVKDEESPHLYIHNAKDCRERWERQGVELYPESSWVLIEEKTTP